MAVSPDVTLLYEKMIRVATNDLTCRIWREPGFNDRQLSGAVWTALRRIRHPTQQQVQDLVTEIIEQEGVNSVEIIGPTGQGICVHKNWP